MFAQKIVIADTHETELEVMKSYFLSKGCEVDTATDSTAVMETINKRLPDAIILDAALQSRTGLEICKTLRGKTRYREIPVLLLSDKKNDALQVECFQSGADDFICHPFGIELLQTRLNTLWRRTGNQDKKTVSIHNLTIDPDQFTVTIGGNDVALAKKEFELLYFLASRAGCVLHRDAILDGVWGDTFNGSDRTLDVHIRKIRKKLNSDCIKTVKGIGYKFDL